MRSLGLQTLEEGWRNVVTGLSSSLYSDSTVIDSGCLNFQQFTQFKYQTKLLTH